MKQPGVATRYRCGVAMRAVAAIGGGYLLAALASAVLAAVLPMPRADAASVATMMSFAIYACAVLWVFAARSALHAWTGVLASAALLGMLLWFSRSVQ
ncbi:DUF3649 domain-containing protein [Noviherbaspirillum sp. CPCC 100848]|uniref:DUF3649 domain-containing protein n=1 Tax=Noviherbaspirillum album TaxID=3080276 RepID=A0ABU6JCS9_9BURK|nr:DUF3649 domain-containing protein [Noviherbaspirillum sp. CPCC 100848]MEC4721251.1 DUF3649 domain-containing protein [Noviherbaspirillum sp. CPCC 100848]